MAERESRADVAEKETLLMWHKVIGCKKSTDLQQELRSMLMWHESLAGVHARLYYAGRSLTWKKTDKEVIGHIESRATCDTRIVGRIGTHTRRDTRIID